MNRPLIRLALPALATLACGPRAQAVPPPRSRADFAHADLSARVLSIRGRAGLQPHDRRGAGRQLLSGRGGPGSVSDNYIADNAGRTRFGGYRNIFADNEISGERRRGIYLYGAMSTAGPAMPNTWNAGIGPLFYNTVEDNRIQDANQGIALGIGGDEGAREVGASEAPRGTRP